MKTSAQHRGLRTIAGRAAQILGGLLLVSVAFAVIFILMYGPVWLVAKE